VHYWKQKDTKTMFMIAHTNDWRLSGFNAMALIAGLINERLLKVAAVINGVANFEPKYLGNQEFNIRPDTKTGSVSRGGTKVI
jgi:hypothetical protein